jgi:exopolyphosphatase/guanosine-5'-triphosphate,3'-diphosphate pyrophosphatase
MAMTTPKKAAVIDMGTNTFHLLLVELHGKEFNTLYKEKVAVKLGQGGITQNQITVDAEKRALHTLGHFKNLIDGEIIDQIFAFATSAVRNATNGPDFVSKVKEELGIEIHVISGEEEAQLIYEGIHFSGSLGEHTYLMMDIGGGSVEFIIGNAEQAFWKQSFEIGGQRLLDAFHYHDPILPEEVEKLEQYNICSILIIVMEHFQIRFYLRIPAINLNLHQTADISMKFQISQYSDMI